MALKFGVRRVNTLWINIKISFVIGLPWIFAFLGNATKDEVTRQVMFYMFIIFNTLQGLFICVSFICTRKVCGLLKTRYVFKKYVKYQSINKKRMS